METEMKRLVMGAQKFPLYLRNIQLKYKLSDWELAQLVFQVVHKVQARAPTQLVCPTRWGDSEAQPDPPRGSESCVASHVVTH
jgi:hypothetical protein